MEVILRDAGYRVLLANRGWSAIKLSQNHTEPLDLLITDVVMPDLTGPVVAERLLVQRPHLRVLFVSGLYDADLVQRFVIRRGFTLLEKPFTAPSLLRVVQEALSAGRPT
jgi:DNA-binding NtrC family response regulator